MTHTLTQTTSIVFKTLPYIILRAIVFTLCALLFLVYMGAVLFISKSLATLFPQAPVFVLIVAFILFYPLSYYLREYVLYLVKAGHVAVIAQLAVNGSLPEGVSQIQWGRDQVQARFKEASVLFLMDRLVHGTIRAVNRLMWGIGNFFSMLPGGKTIIKLANLVLYFSLTYVDESILARNFVKKDETIWQSAKTGVVLYSQSWKEILQTALVCGALSLVLLPILIFLLMTPALAIGAYWPDLKIAAIIGALIFSWVLKAIFLDPWTLTHMVVTYLKVTEGMVPNPEWEAKLEGISSKFKKLKQKTVTPS